MTYVGKDIAYHLWKFGLLGKDFAYRPFHEYPERMSAGFPRRKASEPHPHFGEAQAIYNVIDARQADPQNNVIEALRRLGYDEAGGPLHAFLLRDGGADAALRG